MTKKKQQHTEVDSLIIKQMVKGLQEKRPLSGPDGMITQLLKVVYEVALNTEFEEHLASSKEEGGNRRNGISKKMVKSGYGEFELETQRDRNSSFEPTIIRKRQTIISEEIDNKVLAIFALGGSYEDIQKYVSDIYAVSISDATISSITDKLLEKIAEWRGRPLESTYSVVLLDGMHFKVREEGTVKHKVAYNILGINKSGHKEILGCYLAESEGASFWLSVLNDLKARGVQDILIACVDGLKGFPEAINTSFPRAEVQLCIVHQIRNSLKMVPSKHTKEFVTDLKTVYTASSLAVAEANLQSISSKWSKYHMALKGWQENWHLLSIYFKFSPSIRKLIYTTNIIEGFHRQIRKYTKTKGSFTSENALLKIFYCAITQITSKWNKPLNNWAETRSELDLHFPNRM